MNIINTEETRTLKNSSIANFNNERGESNNSAYSNIAYLTQIARVGDVKSYLMDGCAVVREEDEQ
jgi:hypothetical protein